MTPTHRCVIDKLRDAETWASKVIQQSEQSSVKSYTVPEELIRETPWGEYGANLPDHREGQK